ncbi:MAG: DNA primase [Planctomycetota bacterium]|nr:MAG: DNA primase [Planctomycetota bacterium]
MGYFPPETIQKVQEANDIVEVVQQYLSLEPNGQNLKALCPFHQEKTPSFMVSPQKQIFYCFGCQKGGNVFSFLSEMEKITFPEAVKLLADRAGIPLTNTTTKKSSTLQLYEIQNIACHFFQKLLHSPTGSHARDYLKQRGFQETTIQKFQLGFAPDRWDALIQHAKQFHISPQMLEKAGLAIRKKNSQHHYDRFRNRVIFPILDRFGRICGFGGRTLNHDTPKYINTPETPIFQKKEQLYGLYLALQKNNTLPFLLLMEGYTDVIMAHQQGFPQAVATLGTAFNPRHAQILKRYTRKIYLVFDGDTAGQEASWRSLPLLLNEGLEVHLLPLNGADPCEFLLQHGKKKFQQLLNTSQDALDTYLLSLHQNYKSQKLPEKKQTLEKLSTFLKKIQNPLIQDLVAEKITQLFHIRPTSLQKILRKSTTTPKNSPPIQSPPPPTHERFILETLLQHPTLIEKTFPLFPPEKFTFPPYQKIAKKLQQAYQQKEPPSKIQQIIWEPELQPYLSSLLAEMETSQKTYNWNILQSCLAKAQLEEIKKQLLQIRQKQKQAYENNQKELAQQLNLKYSQLLQKAHQLKKQHNLSFSLR